MTAEKVFTALINVVSVKLAPFSLATLVSAVVILVALAAQSNFAGTQVVVVPEV